jgi:aryl-alcohol dehydrogenase-like predicted oxidoreductase
LKSRRLGNTELTVSEIGLGCQSLGGGLFHGNKRQALDLVAKALDRGITYFDTADHYSLGISEELLGLALRPVRERVIIGTKVGTHYTRTARAILRIRPLLRSAGRPLRPFKHSFDRMRSTQRRADFSLRYLTSAVDASLQRLRTDYIDLLQLHKPPESVLHSGEIPTVIEELRRDGKVRYVGVSCESVSDARICLGIPGIASVQVTINLLDQEAVAGLLPAARERSIGIIARNPRAAGLLTEHFGDITAETYAFNRAEFETIRNDAGRFSFLATNARTLAQAAIRFVLQLPDVSTTTPRALDESELDAMVRASELPDLEPAELERISLTRGQMCGQARKYRYRPASPGTDT